MELDGPILADLHWVLGTWLAYYECVVSRGCRVLGSSHIRAGIGLYSWHWYSTAGIGAKYQLMCLGNML